jgi:hypothetical protein
MNYSLRPLYQSRKPTDVTLWRLGDRLCAADEVQARIKAWHRKNFDFPGTFYFGTFGSPDERRVRVLDPSALDRVLDRYRAEVSADEWDAFVHEILGAVRVAATVRGSCP